MEPHAWERVRMIRFRALADTPDAFGTTLAEDESKPLSNWCTRLENPDSATFLAGDPGLDIGLVVGSRWVGRADTAGLFAMWVAPEARG
ncbi:MAG: GNAT family N-acetyltransferase, partial [Verrucomicrobiales bacterium]